MTTRISIALTIALQENIYIKPNGLY